MPFANKPRVQIFSVHRAYCDCTLIAVDVFSFARHVCCPNLVGEGERCLLAAPIRRAILILTQLGALRCVHSVEADAFASNVKCVTVCDTCSPDKWCGREWGR